MDDVEVGRRAQKLAALVKRSEGLVESENARTQNQVWKESHPDLRSSSPVIARGELRGDEDVFPPCTALGQAPCNLSFVAVNSGRVCNNRKMTREIGTALRE